MGGNHSADQPIDYSTKDVTFDHFQLYRSIGKGSFGKVCIVEKKDTKQMYAMKYMNKLACIQKDAVNNVLREQEILKLLDHPFIVNLWFTFQDIEDMFMVVDLQLGGDLRFHIQQMVKFEEDLVKLYIAEIATALDYLLEKKIVHRDIKPDNVLLDEEGHVHLTDFNIATVLTNGKLASSLSGTRPYMAPEVFECALDESAGYSFPVDWWSLGVTAYECLRGKRPYDIHSDSSLSEIRQMMHTKVLNYPSQLSANFADLIRLLLTINPDHRISTLAQVKAHPAYEEQNWDLVLKKAIKPGFVPPKDNLNCDPSYELEEMIVESNPLHKKKKRLEKAKHNAKQNSTYSEGREDPVQKWMTYIEGHFQSYNREYELKRREDLLEWENTLENVQRGSSLTSAAAAAAHTPTKGE